MRHPPPNSCPLHPEPVARRRRGAKVLARRVAAALFVLLSTTAHAAPLRWTINIDPFIAAGGDVALLSGTFDWDSDLRTLSNINVQVSGLVTDHLDEHPFKPSTDLNGTYQMLLLGSERGLLLWRDLDGSNDLSVDDGMVELGFGTFPSLDSTTGSTDITTANFGYCLTLFSPTNCGHFRLGGSPGLATSAPPGGSGVPLPPAAPLLLAGLLAAARYRRRRGSSWQRSGWTTHRGPTKAA